MVLENKFVVIEFVKFSYKTWESLEQVVGMATPVVPIATPFVQE